MKALSLTQPMAWAVFQGKDIENRNWNTKFRGRVMIHASKKFNENHYAFLWQNKEKLGLTDIPAPEDFIHGAVLGEVDIVSVVQAHSSPWFFGPYGFVLRDAKEYDTPIPCKGTVFPLFFEPKFEGAEEGE